MTQPPPASTERFGTRILTSLGSFAAASGAATSLIVGVIGWPAKAPEPRLLVVAAVLAVVAGAGAARYFRVSLAQHGQLLPFEKHRFGKGAMGQDGHNAILAVATAVATPPPPAPADGTTSDPGAGAPDAPAPQGTAGGAASTPDPSPLSTLTEMIFYKRLIERPVELITRISELVEPHSASQSVRTSFTITLPPGLEGRVVIPLIRSPRGEILNGLRFTGDSGQRLSSLTQAESIGYLSGVIRTLVLGASREALVTYIDYTEQHVLDYILDDRPGPTPTSGTQTDLGSAATIRDNLRNLPGITEDTVVDIMALVLEHAVADVICVAVDVPEDTTPTVPRSVHITVEQATPKAKTYSTTAAPGTRGSTLALRWLPRVREWFGVETTIYRHTLGYAERCSSYHLQIAGPKGSYLAKQAILPTGQPTDTIDNATNIGLGFRSGQRFSHLHIHHDTTRFREWQMAVTFYERPPGTVMLALLSAVAALIITTLCALRVLFATGDAQGPDADLVAVLLAFPPAIALWAGFGDSVRQTLSSHVSRFVTIVVSGTAAFVYILVPAAAPSAAPLWAGITAVLAINAAACGVSLITRTRTHGSVRSSGTNGEGSAL